MFISAQRKKYPECRVPPQATSDRDTPYQAYFDFQNNPVRRGYSAGGTNTHRNKVKWLNKPVQGMQYTKEERQEVLIIFCSYSSSSSYSSLNCNSLGHVIISCN